MRAFEEMTQKELDALSKVGEHSSKTNYIGMRVCYECAKELAVSINIGLQERGRCSRCKHEAVTFEVENPEDI